MLLNCSAKFITKCIFSNQKAVNAGFWTVKGWVERIGWFGKLGLDELTWRQGEGIQGEAASN
jgi:hypothetical protein